MCHDGDYVVPSVILEWLPFSRILARDLIHVPGSTVHLLVDFTLASSESGIVLTMACARPEGSALAQASFTAVVPSMMKGVDWALAAFKERVETASVTKAG